MRIPAASTAPALPPLLALLLRSRAQVQLYHWTTTSLSRHEAADMLLRVIDDVGDRMAEALLGKAGRPPAGAGAQPVQLRVLDDKQGDKLLQELAACLADDGTLGLDCARDPDLLSLRDELLVAVNRARYLFALKP